jgi:acyl-CoA thioester hydrolase
MVIVSQIMEKILKEYPLTIEQDVVWGEMDALNHVNNTVYFRYFENARIAYFDKLKFMQQLQGLHLAPVLASTQCRFKLPLTFPDRITIGARISEISEDRFTMQYAVFSHQHQRVAAEGEALVVAYNVAKQRKDKLPESIVQAIQAIEGHTPD